MSIRLNKALRELNIGRQTAVDFLQKKSELGEVKDDLSFKLNDAQYQALVEAFKQDAAVRSEAEKLFQKKPKEKKRAPEVKEKRAESLLESSNQQVYKQVGKIDLDSVGKKASARKSAAPEEKAPETKAAAVSPEPKKEEKVPEPEAPKEELKAEKPVEKQQVEEPEQPKEPEVAVEKADEGIFTLKSEQQILNTPKVNVLGKIDLNTLNQSTRPKKKSKEEKRKEREEKAATQNGGERKKRARINKERVDINAEAKQNTGNQGNNGGNNGGGNPGGANNGGGNNGGGNPGGANNGGGNGGNPGGVG